VHTFSSCYPHLINNFQMFRSISLSLTVPRPQSRFPNSFFYDDRFSDCQPTPNLKGQSTAFITPGTGWPSDAPGSGYPFWLPFTTCMGCSETNLFPCHHTRKHSPRQGIELRSPACQAGMLTSILPRTEKKLLNTNSVFWFSTTPV
jgi:hypothetical protein